MFIRPSTQAQSIAVQSKLGTLYKDVQVVSDNIDAIITAALGAELALRYAGASTEPPTTRIDGSALQDGDFYFDTSDSEESLLYYDLTETTWFATAGGGSGTIQSVNGETDADIVLDKTHIGLSNVDNTTDLNKPLSTATIAALVLKANASQVLTDVPEDAVFTDTVYDDTALAAAVALNTDKVSNVDHPLVEKAVPSNAVFTDTTYSVGDGGLTQRNFTSTLKTKLDGIEVGAEVNTVSPSDLAGKQDTLVSGTDIKTINSVSILGSGNIEISGGSGGGISDAPADGNLYARKDLSWAVVPASGSGAWGSLTGTLSDQTDLQSALDGKANASQVLTNVPSGAVFTDTVYTLPFTDNSSNWNDAYDWGDHSLIGYLTEAYDDTAVYAAIGNKQDTLVSGSNIKTINGTSLLGSGNIAIAASGTPSSDDITNDSSNVSGTTVTDALDTLQSSKLDATVQAAIDLNTAKVSNVDHPLVEKAVPSNAVFTDTTYTVGDGELSEVNFTSAKSTKLDGIATGANNYTHPANHPASIITQDSSNRFVTDAEKAAWDSKSDSGHGHTLTSLGIEISDAIDSTSSTQFASSAAVKLAAETGDTTDIAIPHTVSGTLTAGGQENQLRDSGSFTMPLANTVDANTICLVTLPDTYSNETPSITTDGSDLFENADGTDTVVNIVSSVTLKFTSDGVSKWYLDVVSGNKGTDGTDGISIPTEIVTEYPVSPVEGTLYIKVAV